MSSAKPRGRTRCTCEELNCSETPEIIGPGLIDLALSQGCQLLARKNSENGEHGEVRTYILLE